MNSKRVNFFICLIIMSIISIIVFFTKLDNSNIFAIIYIGLSLYLMLNYFNDTKISYMRYMYILFILITILFLIFSFNIISIILSIIITILVILQYLKNKKIKRIKKKTKKVKKEIKKEIPKVKIKLPENFDEKEFEKNIKKLYIDMQTYFMNLEYEKLESILSLGLYKQFKQQMDHLNKNNKRAIRDNINIFDFKINSYQKKENELFININIGVIEDKYTKYLDKPDNVKIISYESYYEIEVLKVNNLLKIDNLKLIYSHSKKN